MRLLFVCTLTCVGVGGGAYAFLARPSLCSRDRSKDLRAGPPAQLHQQRHRSRPVNERGRAGAPATTASTTTSTKMASDVGYSNANEAVWLQTDRLGEYVTDSGLVDYSRLAAQEGEWLAPAIRSISTTDPRTMDAAERHAFLINAYNLWTIHYVLRERRSPKWKGAVSTLAKARFFYWHKITTGGGKRNLYDFENKDIRPDVDDARVHFALNCASMSCPPLRRNLFTAAGINAELDEVTSAAINGGALVQLKDNDVLLVNPIFKWYKPDFEKDGGIFAFIKKYWKGPPLPENATIDFFDYDWRTNSVDSTWADRALGGPAL